MTSMKPLLILGVLFAASAAPSSAASILISPTPASVMVGDTFLLDVLGSDLTDLYTYQFDIFFDPARLQANTIIEGNLLAGGGTTFFIPGDIDNTAGLITFTLNSLVGPIFGVTGSGSLAAIEFQALAPGSSLVGVDRGTILLLNSEGNDLVLPTFGDGTIDVTSETDVTTPEPTSGTLIAIGFAAVAMISRLKDGFDAATSDN